MEISFKGKVVVVIGGTSGIGKATVKAFMEAGASVVFTGSNSDKGRAAENELNGSVKNGHAFFVLSDISSESEVRKLADYVQDNHGGCDILFNNAGILLGAELHQTTSEDWIKIMNVNVNGYYYTSKYFIPQMIKKGGGAVVNTSSISGLYADYACCAYNTTKGAITNMTRAMALDYAKYNIRVNAICPGSIRTAMYDMCADSVGREKCERLFNNAYPGNRIGNPEEVANVVLFLASDLASFVNGVNLSVDGGLCAHTGQPKFMD